MKMKLLFLVFLAAGTVAASGPVHAQQYGPDFVGPQQQTDPFAQTTARCGPQSNGDYILCEAVGGIINQRQTNFAAFLRELYMLAFILAGTVAFVRIVYGGVLYSVSAVVNRKKEALDIFKNVAIGMALLMGSYVILNTINPALTILSLPDAGQSVLQGMTAKKSAGAGAAADPSAINTPEANAIREEMNGRVNALGLYSAAPDDAATVEMINGQIEAIGTPTNAAERARLTELQGALKEYQEGKTQTEANAKAAEGAPQQYQRTKTAQ